MFICKLNSIISSDTECYCCFNGSESFYDLRYCATVKD